jgi:hypothetical protein
LYNEYKVKYHLPDVGIDEDKFNDTEDQDIEIDVETITGEKREREETTEPMTVGTLRKKVIVKGGKKTYKYRNYNKKINKKINKKTSKKTSKKNISKKNNK